MSNTNNPAGQLTPETLWDAYSRLIPASESECAPHDDIVVIEKDDFILCAEQYAAQQTAALREELSRIMQMCGVQHVNGEGGALVAVGYVLKERQELLGWKKSQLETFGPLLDFGQSAESGIPIGASIVQEAINALKERDWLKEQFNLLRDKYSRIVPERDGLKTANVGLQEVLHNTLSDRNEAVKLLKSASDIVKKCNYPGACYSVPAILKALFDNNVNSFISRLSSGETKPDTCANLASQLKKAMPETYPGKAYQPLFDHMSKEHNLTLLESEMQEIISIVRKMDSPWIRVKDRLPELTEPMMWYNDEKNVREVLRENDHAIVLAYSPEMGVFKAKLDGRLWSEISSISIKGSILPTHWMPLPAPPESLTDKK